MSSGDVPDDLVPSAEEPANEASREGEAQPAPEAGGGDELTRERLGMVVREILPMVDRAAILSAPLVQVREPMFVAAVPIPLEYGRLVGGMLMSLQVRGVPVMSYISHGPTQRYVEGLLGFDIPIARPEKDGSLARAAGGRYTARHRDLVISLHILRKLKCGEALDESAFRELESKGRVRLILLYYYRICPESFSVCV
jgi:hypothetical protein